MVYWPERPSYGNFVAKVVLTPMAPGGDAEFAEILDEFRAVREATRATSPLRGRATASFHDLIPKMKTGDYPKPEIVPMDSSSRLRAGPWATSYPAPALGGIGTVRLGHRLQGAAFLPQSQSGGRYLAR
jgi:hypothetical protein